MPQCTKTCCCRWQKRIHAYSTQSIRRFTLGGASRVVEVMFVPGQRMSPASRASLPPPAFEPLHDVAAVDFALAQEVAQALADGKVVAWFQGRGEFGPRALGSRSLLADPRDPAMPARINADVKKRCGDKGSSKVTVFAFVCFYTHCTCCQS